MQDAETRLWRAVVLQALTDIAAGEANHRDEAIHWMSSKDFIEVCDAADAQPHAVRQLAWDLSATPDRQRRIWMLSRIRERLAIYA